MRLTDIKNGASQEWQAAGYELPKFDIDTVREKHIVSLHGYISEQEIFFVHFRQQSYRIY
ncbi:MAG: hypothetical protein ACLSGB_13760 [Dorea sp.]